MAARLGEVGTGCGGSGLDEGSSGYASLSLRSSR